MESCKGVPKALLRHSMRKILPQEIVSRTWKTDARDFIDYGMVQDYARLANTLTPNGLSVRLGYVKPEAMKQERILFDKAVFESSTFPGNSRKFVALELWLESYFGSDPLTPPKEAADPQCDSSATLKPARAANFRGSELNVEL
jgi:hypothetical protein